MTRALGALAALLPGLALGVALAGRAGVAAAEPEHPLVKQGLDWVALPIVDYSSDRGVGYGARLMLFDYGDDIKPFRYALRLQLFQTSAGVAAHRLYFDVPAVRGSRWRVDGSLNWVADQRAPWYGLGSAAKRVPAYTRCADRAALSSDPDHCPDNPLFRGLYYYNYRAVHPRGVVNLRRELRGPWQLVSAYSMRLGVIETHYPDEKLAQTGDSQLIADMKRGEPIVGLEVAPNGAIATTRTAEMLGGVAYDTRDIEAAPTQGSWHEVSARAASPALGGQFSYYGVNLTLRSYRALDRKRRVVFASRVIFDWLGGDVPFYQLPLTGGLRPIHALGGLGSIRGLTRARYIGKIKLLGNGELRWSPYSLWLGSHRIDMGGLVGVDLGRVWRDLDDQGSLFDMPVSGVVGFRAVYDENLVLSVDYGRSLTEGTSGVYLNFNHMY